jgi:hypothetical protein
MKLESLYICIKFDYLIILKEFFMSNLPVDKTKQIIESEHSLTISSDTDVETRVDILVKNPEIILLEDQCNSNSNGLVLNVSRMNILKSICKKFYF